MKKCFPKPKMTSYKMNCLGHKPKVFSLLSEKTSIHLSEAATFNQNFFKWHFYHVFYFLWPPSSLDSTYTSFITCHDTLSLSLTISKPKETSTSVPSMKMKRITGGWHANKNGRFAIYKQPHAHSHNVHRATLVCFIPLSSVTKLTPQTVTDQIMFIWNIYVVRFGYLGKRYC